VVRSHAATLTRIAKLGVFFAASSGGLVAGRRLSPCPHLFALHGLSLLESRTIFSGAFSNSPPGGVLEIRIAPGPGPAVAARATPGPPVPAERTVGSRRPTARRRGDPRFDARCPRLALNATGISTAVPHGRAQADGRARARRAGPVGQTRPDRAAEGRTRPRREPRVPLHRVSGETMRVVVFHRRRGGRRPRDRRPEPPAST